MHFLCLVLVTVFAGQACHGYQGPFNTLDRARRGSTRAEQDGLREHPGHRKHDTNLLKKRNKKIKTENFSDEDDEFQPAGGVLHNPAASTPVRTDSHTPNGDPTAKANSVLVPLMPPEPLVAPRRLLHPPTRDGGGEEEDREAPWPFMRPSSSFHFPIDMDVGKPCKKSPGMTDNIATAPPNVCDLCPSENGKNPLDPCTVRKAARTRQSCQVVL